MDIERVLLGLAFVGLIFILLNSYCGCNILEGIEEPDAYCNQNSPGSRCPGIDGVMCSDLTDCQNKKECPCPTREEILKNICPPPSCPPPDNSKSIFLIKDGEDYGAGYLFKKILIDNYKDAVFNLKSVYASGGAPKTLTDNPLEDFIPEKYFLTLDPPIKILITPKNDSSTYTFTSKLVGRGGGGNFLFHTDTVIYPDKINNITNQEFIDLFYEGGEGPSRNFSDSIILSVLYNDSKVDNGASNSYIYMKNMRDFNINISLAQSPPRDRVYDNSKVKINSLEVKF